MIKHLEQGQKIISVFWSEGEAIEVGKAGCLNLVISMECGQMAGVPWVIVTYEDGKEYRYNLAMTEGIRTK